MAVTTDQLLDLVNQTLPKLNRGKISQIATRLVRYEAMGRILRKERVTVGSGDEIEFQIKYKQTGAARNVSLYDEDVVNFVDTGTKGKVPWRHTNTYFGFDEREISMNRGAAQIVNLLKSKQDDAMISLVEKQEENFWSKPLDSSDQVTPYGMPMWIVKASTTGFGGGNPSGFPNGVADVDVSVVANFKNYTAQYTDVTKSDLIQKMRRGKIATHFESPINLMDFRFGRGDELRYYCNLNTHLALAEVGEQQNDNLGRDIGSMDGQMVLHGNPIIYVPYLDADTTDPIYQINWAFLQAHFLRGEYLRRSPAIRLANKHRTIVVWTDNTWNAVCVNRREQAVYAKAA